jgi:lactoylglutathione lyase
VKKRFVASTFCTVILLLAGFTGISQAPTRPVLNHVALFVTNLKTSVNFYKDVVGLDTIAEPFKDGKHAWFKIGTNAALHIIEGADKKPEYPRNAHVCFSVGSLTEFLKGLKTKKIPFEDKDGKPNTITKRVDGVSQIYFKDPDNYWIEMNDAKF